MYHFKIIYPPIADPENEKHLKERVATPSFITLSYYFNCVMIDGSIQFYNLSWICKTSRFNVTNLTGKKEQNIVNPHMFTGDLSKRLTISSVQKVKDALVPRLKPEHLAQITYARMLN